MRLVALAAAAALLAGAAASAQTDAETRRAFDCSDGGGADRCAPEAERRLLDAYRLEPIEQHRLARDFVRRIFYVDTNGDDLLAIAFIRRPSGEPELSVHMPRSGAAEPVAPMRVPVPESEWDIITYLSAYFHRSFVPTGESAFGVCHGSTMVVEATDMPAFMSEDPAFRIRRKVENSCTDGPAGLFASVAAFTAVSLLPPCALIDLAGPPTLVDVLRACALLTGDRNAAARAFNHAYRINNYNEYAETFADQNTVLQWSGEAQRTGAAAGALWTERTAGERWIDMRIGRVRGEDAGWATVTGRLHREIDGRREEAEVEQEWGDGPFRWRLVRMNVGPFRRVP